MRLDPEMVGMYIRHRGTWCIIAFSRAVTAVLVLAGVGAGIDI